MRHFRDLVIRRGGLTFFGQASHGGSRFGFGVATWEGLTDGVDMRRDTPERPGRPGAFALPGIPGSRMIAWRGTCVAPNPEKLTRWGQELSGQDWAGGYLPLEVSHAGLTYTVDRTAYAVAPEFRPQGPRDRASYSVRVWSPDPWYFGAQRSFPAAAQVEVWHEGTAPATPSIILRGGTAPGGFRLVSGAGQVVSCTTPVASGNRFTVDFSRGVLLNSNGAFAGVLRGEPLQVPPGQTTWLSVGYLNGGSGLTIEPSTRDTYM